MDDRLGGLQTGKQRSHKRFCLLPTHTHGLAVVGVFSTEDGVASPHAKRNALDQFPTERRLQARENVLPAVTYDLVEPHAAVHVHKQRALRMPVEFRTFRKSGLTSRRRFP
jgi:hypothetical protein